MAGKWYRQGLIHLASGSIDWVNDDIRVLLVRSTGGGTGPYYSEATADDYLDVVPNNVDCRAASAVQLTGKTMVDNSGVIELRANNPTFSSVGSPGDDNIDLAIVFKFNASEAAAELIGIRDSLVISPNGEDITLDFSGANNVVFTLQSPAP